MKKLLKTILILLVFIAGSSFNMQCWFSSLQDDLKAGSTEFKAFIKNDSEAFASYEILYNQAPALKTNVEELTLVSKNIDEINKAGGYVKWKAINKTVKVLKDFKKPIDFGGDILKTPGKKLAILGRVGPSNKTIGTIELYNELKLKGIPENEISGLFQPIPKEWDNLLITEQNTKYWKEINEKYIDDVIASSGDIRFIHDPRLDGNTWNYVKDMPTRTTTQIAFKNKCIEQKLVKIRTFMRMEYDYLVSKGYVLQETGLMIKP